MMSKTKWIALYNFLGEIGRNKWDGVKSNFLIYFDWKWRCFLENFYFLTYFPQLTPQHTHYHNYYHNHHQNLFILSTITYLDCVCISWLTQTHIHISLITTTTTIQIYSYYQHLLTGCVCTSCLIWEILWLYIIFNYHLSLWLIYVDISMTLLDNICIWLHL